MWKKIRVNFWSIVLLLLSIVLVIPLTPPLISLILPQSQIWEGLFGTVLWAYLSDTVILAFGVLSIAAILGILPAWLLSRYEVPLPKLFEILLTLPLAIPPYISAYAYSGIFDLFGPIWNFGQLLGLPEEALRGIHIRNMGGLIFVMSFALSPYVFLLMRNSFRYRIARTLDASQTLGASEARQLFGLALPLSRPALFASLTIILMEVLNDYAAATYYGQNTLSVGIIRTWFANYDLPTAQAIAGLLVVIVFLVLIVDRLLRGHRRFDPQEASAEAELKKIHTSKTRSLAHTTIICIPVLFGFVFPFLQLISWALREFPFASIQLLFEGFGNTLLLAGISALVITVLGVFISFLRSIERSRIISRFSDLSLLGHSIPGSVIALGVLGISQGFIVVGLPFLLSGSILLLIYSYIVRFLAYSQRSVSTIFLHQLRRQDEASLSLGKTPMQTLFRLHLPNLKFPIATAVTISSLELIQELPLTIILSPFNFQTLAVHTYQLTSQELVQASSVPAILLVLISVLIVIGYKKTSKW